MPVNRALVGSAALRATTAVLPGALCTAPPEKVLRKDSCRAQSRHCCAPVAAAATLGVTTQLRTLKPISCSKVGVAAPTGKEVPTPGIQQLGVNYCEMGSAEAG